MYAIGSSAARGFGNLFSWGSVDAGGGVNENFRGGAHMDYHQGFGIIPAIAVSAGVSLLGGLFGPHSGKTTHAQRFLQAQSAGDMTTAHALIDQAYSHAFIESIPDKGEWMQVWQVMLNEADPGNASYMHQKLGVGGTAAGSGGVTGSPNQPGNTPALSSMAGALFSPLGIGLALGLLYLSRRGR